MHTQTHPPRAPRVTLVDEDPSFVDLVGELLGFLDVDLVAPSEPFELTRSFRRRSPECLVLDVRLKGISGLELHEALVQAHGPVPTVFASAHGDVPVAVRAMKQGAIDFLEKPVHPQSFVDAIQTAIQSDFRPARPVVKNHSLLQRLTPREREVLEHVVQGSSSKQIAFDLGISRKTVELHRAHIMKKLEVHSVANLVGLALS